MTQTQAGGYRAFDAKGAPVTLDQIVASLADADVLFVGEMHDDAVAHLIEAELLRRAHERYGAGGAAGRRAVALSLEMFESDVQVILDEYLGGLISERHFLLSSRPWRNYETDYRPLVEYARDQQLPVVAANAPARYVNRVTLNGPASLARLSPAALAWLPPLPYAPASEPYAVKFRRFLNSEAARTQTPPSTTPPTGQAPTAAAPANPHASVPNPHAAHVAHGRPTYLLDAQNLRDASMAYRIAEFLGKNRNGLVVHVNGNFHSEGRLGVPEHLARYNSRARAVVVTIVRDEGYPNFDAPRLGPLGDFVIVTDPAAPRSQR
jgi:uncharacterized iron-regulated protein